MMQPEPAASLRPVTSDVGSISEGSQDYATVAAQHAVVSTALVPAGSQAVTRSCPSIQICFSNNARWFSRVLRWILRSRISHACLTYRNETFDGKVMVLELQGRGFVSVSWKRWRRHNRVLARYSLQLDSDSGLSEADVRRALAELAEWLGTPFDYLSLLGFWLRPLVRNRRVLFNSPRKLVCSGAVATFLKAAGFDAIEDPDAIDPVELHSLIERHEYLFVCEQSEL